MVDSTTITISVLMLLSVLDVGVFGQFNGGSKRAVKRDRLADLRLRRRPHKRGFMYGKDSRILFDTFYRSLKPEIGFHTELTKTQSFTQGNTIIFDNVITNLGAAYHRQSGTFKCPTTGTYIFTLNILCEASNYMEAAIMQNDIPILKVLSYNRVPGTYNQGSGSAVVRLSKGDQVKVIMVKPMSTKEILLGGFSYFSGYLLTSS